MKLKVIAISAALIVLLLGVAFLIYQKSEPAQTESTGASQSQDEAVQTEQETDNTESTLSPEQTMPMIPFDVGAIIETTAPQEEDEQEPAATESEAQITPAATEPEETSSPAATEPAEEPTSAATEPEEEIDPEMTIPDGLDDNELPPIPF